MSVKGTRLTIPKRIVKDARTGRELWIISPEGVNSGASYMYIMQFSPDERYVFYESEVSGALQLHRYEIATGALTQVTEGPGFEVLNWNVHPAGREVFYAAGGKVWAADIETLESRLVFDPSLHPWVGKRSDLIMFSKKGRWFSFGFKSPEGLIGVGRASCDGKEVEHVYTRPRGEGVQHVMFCNTEDEDWMSFAPAPDHQTEWSEPRERRARVYLVHARAGTVEPVFVQDNPLRATHEYWSPNGDRLYFHRKTHRTWVPTAICSCDRRTRAMREIYLQDTLQLGHSFYTADERWIVTDVQKAHDNPLILIETATGKSKVLCWPNSSVAQGRDRFSHVHPSFSPKATYVLFTSDAGGLGQVYLVPRATEE